MLTGSASTVRRARELRRAMSPPEVKLWLALRSRPGGWKFRRQQVAGGYVLDFYCSPARLAVEVDGQSHDRAGRPERDSARDVALAMLDIGVLRVAARDVFRDVDAVVRMIVAQCQARTQSSPERGGGARRPPRDGGAGAG